MLIFKDKKLSEWSVVSANVLIQKSLHSMLCIQFYLSFLLSPVSCIDIASKFRYPSAAGNRKMDCFGKVCSFLLITSSIMQK